MASLKDLLVMGPARFLNTLYGNTAEFNNLKANMLEGNILTDHIKSITPTEKQKRMVIQSNYSLWLTSYKGGNSANSIIFAQGIYNPEVTDLGLTEVGRFDADGSFKTKGSITTEGSLTVGNSITAKSIVAEDGIINGNLYVTNSSEEVRIGAKYNNESGTLWMYGRPDRDLRGIWDTKINDVIIQINEDNFVRFNGTANKADILATSRTFTISSTAADTGGTLFNGSENMSLIIPSSISGFLTLSGTPTEDFKIIGNSTLYLISGSDSPLVFCRGGISPYEVGKFDEDNNFIVKNTVQGKLLQIKCDDDQPRLSLLYGDYGKGTCYLTVNDTSNAARMGFYVYNKNGTTGISDGNYINFRLPEVTSDLIGSRDYDILVADEDGNISLDRSLFLKIRNSEFDSQRLGIDYKKNNATSSSTFYMFANIDSGNRGIHDSVTLTNIIRINGSNNTITFTGTEFIGTDFKASNNMYVNNKKVYHEGTIFYGSDKPNSPVAGMIWLKPLSQTQG